MNPDDPVSDRPARDDAAELSATAEREGLPFLSSVTNDMLVPGLVENLPVEWARANRLLPVRIDGRTCVLTSDPSRIDAQEHLALLLGEDLQPVVTTPEIISDSIERCYYRRESSARDLLDTLKDDGKGRDRAAHETSDLLEDAGKAPVTQLVNLILLGAVKRSASDIHFEPFESRLRVRYRIDGVLYEQESPPKHLEQALVSRLKVMARMDIAEKRLPQDGMASVRVGGREIDVRVSTVPVAEGERVVLRLLDRKSALLSLEELGMQRETSETLESLLASPYGIIIVSGPTGSGKTTTLYAALTRLDARRRNIMTIEDPVEYRLPDIGQIQVKPKIGLTFASGLRHILRQDPDVVLVGETRDAETAGIAIRASLTGHLVFTTLHTNDAAGAIVRLTDIGIETYLLASSLKGVLAQRLVRKLCPVCRRETVLPSVSTANGGLPPGLLDEGERIWEPAGCEECLEGHSGRTGVFELMTMDEHLQDVVRSGGMTTDALRRAAEGQGLCSMLSDGISKVRAGVTDIAEIRNLVEVAG